MSWEFDHFTLIGCFICFVLDETIPVMGEWGGLSETQRTKTLNDVLFVCFKMNLKPSYLGTYIRVYRNWREFLPFLSFNQCIIQHLSELWRTIFGIIIGERANILNYNWTHIFFYQITFYYNLTKVHKDF